MKWSCLLAIPLALMPLVPSVVLAQQPPPAQAPAAAPDPDAVLLSRPELEQLLAPIALYPDELLTQTLIASTYPLEVVMASRWVSQGNNKDLKGDALLKALDGQDWDPSVKSLVPFPVVLATMSDQLEWTQKLGDAFLAQQNDVFAAVQALRGRAQAAGQLKTTEQQVVTQQADVIVIAPAQPQVVYVPAYNPTVVYGAWPYAAYPPVYYPPPPGYYVGSALMTGLAFGAGIAITSSLWGWGRPNWGHGNVNINVNNFNSINSNRYNNYHPNRPNVSGNTWAHNPDHRRGVSYSNPKVNQQYRPNAGTNAGQRDAYRGRPEQGGANRPGGGTSPQQPGGGGQPNAPRPNGGNAGGNAQRPGGGNTAPTRPSGGNAGATRPQGGQTTPQRPNGGNAGGAQSRPQPAARPNGGNGSALQGANNGAAARAQSAQGRSSRAPAAAKPAARPAPAGRSGGGAGGGETGMNMQPFGARIGAMLLALSLIAAAPAPKLAAFPTPDAGVDALVAALQANDHDRLVSLFGADGVAELASGDEVSDANERTVFLDTYGRKHALVVNDTSATLVIGDDDWPFPIPLAKNAAGWTFDVAAGKEEILDRRIGANELFTQEALLAYSDAQQEYSHAFHDGHKIHLYAQHFLSSPGKQDGLYWETEEGEKPSPLGDLVAEASAAGYTANHGTAQPFHGYFYKILTAQGPHAPGGAYDYKVKNLMIGGYAAIAWPANWGHTGVMTFVINQDGDVYQKNLGPKTADLAKSVTRYDPDATWTKLGAPPPSPGASD